MFARNQHPAGHMQVIVQLLVCMFLKIAYAPRDICATHEHPSKCAEQASTSLMHLCVALLVGVYGANILGANLAQC
eukprot:11745987-Prorocentrum_lima.AAC.1